ncbi:MAG: T9SS type A sorting domain-containing protein [Flavobacteriaceae bacterium]
MEKYLYLIAIVFCSLQSVAQFGPQRIISTEADGSRIICAADVDGDNYIDILSANKFAENLTWYKNLDGLGNFGGQNIIAELGDAIHVHAADLDGDGDMDVLAVSYYFDMVVWYENLDGLGNFSSQKIISNTTDGAYIVIAADIDGDGNMDVISGSDNTGIAWYENMGNGIFGPIKIVDSSASIARHISLTDLDGDGDLDIIGSSSGANVSLSWYENLNGLGDFSSPNLIDESNFALGPICLIDLDGDNNKDILLIAAVSGADKVVWYHNSGAGNFSSQIVIHNDPIDVWSIYSADLDQDGDNDVLITRGAAFNGQVVWFENLDGQGSFGNGNVIGTQHQFPRSVIAADIDNDGDMDVIASSQNDDKIAWYENYTILGIEENKINSLKIYPNPTKGLIYINSKTETIIGITVFDVLGKKVLQLEGNIQQLEVSTLQRGMYFLRIVTEVGDFAHKIIKE